MQMTYDKNEFYRAHLARDPRFDGKFFVAVKTTKIYCRPICPARKAKLKNLEFFIHAAQAEEAGFRPCLRCRPETAPGSAAWIGTSSIIQRAIRMMDSFALEDLSIGELAKKLEIGDRWLRDLFQNQVGASPQSVLISKKLDTAGKLLDESSLSVTEIAFSSGFQSIRRFNDAFKNRFQKSPSAFRKNPVAKGPLRLQLTYRPPFAWNQLINFFKDRAVPGLEIVEGSSYQRLITDGDVCGWFKAIPIENNKIEIEFKLNKNANLLEFVARLKKYF
jgi:AraC family transcriptional regulator, regulatory protein of adaptative response / DNA-3-methyladenine glycosylase II